MDLTESIAPKSDQINAEDLLTGPRTFTIDKVNAGNTEQPINVHLKELPGRPYRPSKSMRRLLVAAWGAEGSAYEGRRLTLYRNPDIKFGGDKVGGIEISHLSHINKPIDVALAVTRGRRKIFTVAPLREQAPATPTIPDDVVRDTAKAGAEGTIDQYIAWLAERNAPEHIIEYVSERKPS
jgi:hypothetical protein